MQQNILFALLLSFLAGAATLAGGFISFIVKKDDMKIFSIGMGFSAGVMIFVSFMELLPVSIEAINSVYSIKTARWIGTSAFFGGIILAGIIDQLIPEHHITDDEIPTGIRQTINSNKIKKVGIFTALAMAVHNFPEGLATFMSALESPALGISICAAIGIHNVPEGMAVAMPIYSATNSRKKALWYSALSGMAEPLGAAIGFLFLRNIYDSLTAGIVFAAVAGIMIYISFDELLPTANEYGDGHKEILGVLVGMFVMAISLLMLN
ncbi:MAG: zinc transporter ZupT [Elusimicrobiota bacterium]|jgi:ZIP family zinc transporter|nr:zinc transporter ZupT [Elusimicrobiota bacterium]